ncbi:MAG: hypothetical protein QN170_08435, partial [Armatimonadota bacterium]|nr:hypothetical protein [Armatimonadota bacterium]
MRAATGTGAVHAESRRTARLPLLVPGGLSLLVGMWVGLRRAGWPLPELAGAGLADHAALMISGFLGTLIALERAAALRRTWTFLAPALSGAGAVALLAGLPRQLAVLLFALSGAALSCAYL